MPRIKLASERVGIALILALFLCFASALHDEVGDPPQFTSQPQDVVVFDQDTLLSCEVTGTPVPTIRWFRGSTDLAGDDQFVVFENGSLLLANITEGVHASREGLPYYCLATNLIGPDNVAASIRSRTATVSLAYFDGFLNDTASAVPVSFYTGTNNDSLTSRSDVVLECDVGGANPSPDIEWYSGIDLSDQNQGDIISATSRFVFLENNRYLFIRTLVEADITNIQYRCEVTNVLIDQPPRRSPIIYTLDPASFPFGELVVYKEIGEVSALVGEGASFSYVAAVLDGNSNNRLSVDYESLVDSGLTISEADGVGSVEDIPLELSGGEFSVMASYTGPVNGAISGTLRVFDNAEITSGGGVLRELLAGEREVVLTCESRGFPEPDLVWYYNGEDVTADGVSVDGNTLTIPSPAVSHSGIYQCFVTNSFGDDSVAWVLEIRDPVVAVVTNVGDSNPGSSPDRREGTLVVVDDPASNTTISFEVEADPCPSASWLLNGETEVVTTAGVYEVVSPCNDPASRSPYRFSVIVSNLTAGVNIGGYVATFSNLAGSTTSSQIFITPTVTVTFESISVTIAGSPETSCLLSGSDATVTCNVEGFPRPEIDFLIGGVLVVPGAGSFDRVTRTEADQILVENVGMADEGSYGCRVANDSSAPITTADFQYCTIPEIDTLSVMPSEIVVGGTITITCEVSGQPRPDITWFLNEEELSDSMNNGNLRIVAPSGSPGTSLVEVTGATVELSGTYRCVATNLASSASMDTFVEVDEAPGTPVLSTGAIIGIAAGGAGGIILLVVVILLLVCVYSCARSGKKESVSFSTYPSYGGGGVDYSDGRGNVDKESDEEEEEQPEAFNPQYESLPALRPPQPPSYKPTPNYPHGGPLTADDIEMTKVPPPDTDSFVGVPPYMKQDNGNYRPQPDDFLSEDAQFV